MVQYQNLTRKPELFQAPLGPGSSTTYPLNPPLAGPDNESVVVQYLGGFNNSIFVDVKGGIVKNSQIQ